MSDAVRHKDVRWVVRQNATVEEAALMVLQDIRDELKQFNRTFSCQNFLEVPHILCGIRRNTTTLVRKAKQ